MLNMTLIGNTSLFFRDAVLGMYVGQHYLQPDHFYVIPLMSRIIHLSQISEFDYPHITIFFLKKKKHWILAIY